jgi:Protein of unknown function (DUF3168)
VSDALLAVQRAAVAVIEAHPGLASGLSGVFDGPAPRTPYPYVSVAGGLSSDWSTKTALGREVRLALTVWDDGEEPTRLQALVGQVEEALAALPRDLPGWRMASNIFLRSVIARDAAGPWAGLVEQRIRLLSL